MTKLTVKAIQALKPRAKIHKVADGSGLNLFVLPSGSKIFRLRYRIDKKEKTYTIGPFPDVSLSEARIKAHDLRREIRKGIDVSKVKSETIQQERSAPNETVAAIVARFRKTKVDGGWSYATRDKYDSLMGRI